MQQKNLYLYIGQWHSDYVVCECSNVYSIGSPLNAKATLLWFGLKAVWENLYVSQKKFLAFPQESFLVAATPPFFPTTNLSSPNNKTKEIIKLYT